MSDQSVNAPLKKGNTNSLWVWFNGATALKEGQGLVYDALNVTAAMGAATVAAAKRYNQVSVPAVANAGHFAGVAARDYPAQANGQFIEIYGPGSVCYVLTYNVSTTVGTTALGCSYDASGTTGSLSGTFKASAVTGKAGAIALQTITGTTAFQKVLAVLQEGVQSGVIA